jgi:dethiobiotin synthetase
MDRIAVLGIHTGIGKTIVSAVIAEALGADYWKPVQAGLEERDSSVISGLITNGAARIHPEAVVLTQPLSPHEAAEIDGVTVDHKLFQWPVTHHLLIAETAGGVLSPISATETVADFTAYHNLPVLLVVQHYLGSINHTLLCLEVLAKRNINVLGMIVSGTCNKASESFIETYSNKHFIAAIPQLETVDATSIARCAQEIKQSLEEILNGTTEH